MNLSLYLLEKFNNDVFFEAFGVIRHLKLKCLTHKMINFKFERF